MKVKFQNSKANRKALIDAGFKIHDPHKTFNRKSWIIIGDDGKLYGVQFRNIPTLAVEEFLSFVK